MLLVLVLHDFVAPGENISTSCNTDSTSTQ